MREVEGVAEIETTIHSWRRVSRWVIWSPLVLVPVWFGLNMESLGHRIQQPNYGLDYTMGVFWWTVFALCILVFARESRQMLMIAWLGKFFIVLVAMLFYEQHYGLDAYGYFRLSLTGEHWMYEGYDWRKDLMPSLRPRVVDGSGTSMGGGVGTENTLRFMLLIAQLTGPFYHAMKVACAFFGLLGMWWFYRAATVVLERQYPPAFYLLAFFPSILFWSSILGKDPLQFFFAGIYAYGAALWFVQARPSAAYHLGIGLIGMYMFRPWSCMMAGIALVLSTALTRCRRWQVGLAVLPFLALPFFSPGSLLTQEAIPLNFQQAGSALEASSLFLDFLETRATAMAGDTQKTGGSGVDLESIGANAFQASLPVALFTGLFRPLPFDISNPFTALAALENTIIFVLTVMAITHFRLKYLRDPLVLWPALYCLFWDIGYGYIVLANFGSGVRYKLQVWPFFLMILILLAHKKGRALLESRAASRP